MQRGQSSTDNGGPWRETGPIKEIGQIWACTGAFGEAIGHESEEPRNVWVNLACALSSLVSRPRARLLAMRMRFRSVHLEARSYGPVIWSLVWVTV